LLAFAFGLGLLRESRDASHARPDLLGTAVLTVAVEALALGLVKAPEWGLGRGAGTLAAIAGLAVFWRCSGGAASRTLPRRRGRPGRVLVQWRGSVDSPAS
jgi:hypothetical protein